jgi:NADH-quinone oxidoreductase subunit L
LGAGAVIHAVHSNEMQDMGGLRKYLPITHITFLIACLAIAGIPPFSGFFSKDEILVAAFHNNMVIFSILYLVAGLTAFYMFRLYYRIFWGESDTSTTLSNRVDKPHEAGLNMTIPLIFLGVLTVVTGFIPFSKFVTADGMAFAAHIEWSIASASVAVGVLGIAIATILYRVQNAKPDKIAASVRGFYVATSKKFYFDEVWLFVAKNVIFNNISRPVAWFDRHVIDGFMNMWATVSNWTATKIKGIQSGITQDYAWAYIVGALVIVALMVGVFV